MSYTVIGLFPTNEMADEASTKLDSAGFAKGDYSVSRFESSGEYKPALEHDYHYAEDEKTSNFWGWLFGEDDLERKRYSYAGTKSNVVTVYTNDLDRAEKARDIMNDNGAINVNDFSQNYMKKNYAGHEEFASTDNNMKTSERARILDKAKNNQYLNPESRSYRWGERGMSTDMDSQGYKDNL